MSNYHVRTILVVSLALLASGGCRDRVASSDFLPLARSSWLGRSEDWGLLGIPQEAGAVSYRRALDLQAPTWVPPLMEPVRAVKAGHKSLWVRFEGQLGFYDYSTGHSRSYESSEGGALISALGDRRAIMTSPDRGTLIAVGPGPAWRLDLGGTLQQLIPAGDLFLAVVETPEGNELLSVDPAQSEAVARRRIDGLLDVAVTPWGHQVYCLTTAEEAVLVGFALPDLEPIPHVPLERPGEALAITPSGHRLYVASGSTVYALDRASRRVVQETDLPAAGTALRFGRNGSHLLVRLDRGDRFAVLRVGVDSLLAVLPGGWSEDLPQGLPGGRLVVRASRQLILYDLPNVNELNRVDEEVRRFWSPVEWRPPRPSENIDRRPTTPAAMPPPTREPTRVPSDEPLVTPQLTGPRFYAVLLSAREAGGVEEIVEQLRGSGYPGVMDRHEDIMEVTWYRAMVGPYPSRDGAEAAARELRARFGYASWILAVEGDESRSESDEGTG